MARDGAGRRRAGHGNHSCRGANRDGHGHDIGHGGITFSVADSAFAFACNSYNRVTVAAWAEIKFLRATHLGDVLVATAMERSRDGRDGIYDVTVSVGEDVVAEFVGRSREIGGTLFA